MKELITRYMRVIKFGAVGIVNTAVDFLVFTMASELLVMKPAGAQSLGYGAGIVCSFVLNRFVTFSDAKKERGAGQFMRIVRFLVVNGVSWAVSAGLIELFTGLGMWKYLAKLVVTGVTMVLNYFGYKILVFNIKEG
ncbi:MAG: GtrA family protein [Candidatus Heteroscillospira sp.]